MSDASASINRRTFLTTSAAALGGVAATALFDTPVRAEPPGETGLPAGALGAVEPITLPALPYAYDALEPFIDAKTMEIHHSRHHAAYVRGFNAAQVALAAARESGDFSAVAMHSRAIAFHGGGHVNHAIFWQIMAPAGKAEGKGGGEPVGLLAEAIRRDFGGFAGFKAQFSAAARAVEASGWAVLAWNGLLGQLTVQTMLNQQNLQVAQSVPIVLLDVWEHAYYLKYQNDRGAYVDAWWNVVNWSEAQRRFAEAVRR